MTFQMSKSRTAVFRRCTGGLFPTAWTAMYNVVNEDIAVGAEVVFTFRTPISTYWAHSIGRRCRRRSRHFSERHSAAMASRRRVLNIVHGHAEDAYIRQEVTKRSHKKHEHRLIGFDREQMVITSGQVGRAHYHESADVAICRDIADLGGTPWAQEPFALEL